MNSLLYRAVICIMFTSSFCFAGTRHHDEGKLESSFSVPPVVSAMLKISTEPVDGEHPLVSKKMLVYHNDQVYVYRLRNGSYKLIPVNIKRNESKGFLIQSRQLAAKDRIVSESTGLLHIYNIYQRDDASYEHAH